MRYLLFIFVVLISLNFVSAAADPAPPYCERMGYTIENRTLCVFDDGNSCNLWEFYSGECGSEYVKELPCVPLGEAVFSHEECCEGIPYAPPGLIGQSTCQPVSKSVKAWLAFYVVPTIIILVLIIIVYVIYRKLRKKK